MRTCPSCQRAFSDDTDFCPRDGTPLPAAVTATGAQLGAGLARRFRIVRHLGAGGMGAVFLAEQIQIGNRPVALKVLLRKLLDDPEFLLRFQNEAASTGRIHHPNVVTIYESGQADDGTPYIAMEYLEGETLRATIQRRGALSIPECTEIIQQAARGLGAAHRLGIIHRDLKPDNIFLTRGEEGGLVVKVVDFGIAKLRESATHTVTGMVLGTPQYMSFEQASGMRSEELDARSDLYSLGIITYEMLTGRLPFHSDTPLGYLRKHLTEEPPPFRAVKSDLPAYGEIENVVMKALAKDREQRYASVREFAQELAQATQAMVEGSEAAMPPTRRVAALSPASTPEPVAGGRPGVGSIEPGVQTSPPASQRFGPGAEPPRSSQQAPSMGDRQSAGTFWPRLAALAERRGRAKYWAAGLVGVAALVAAGIWYPHWTGPKHAEPSSVPPGRTASVSPEASATANDAAHLDRASLLARARDWDGAISEYRAALRLNPDNDNAHRLLGLALREKGDQVGEIAEYREALRLNPESDLAHSNLGVALGEKGDQLGEIAEYREALRLNPKNHFAHYNLGLTLESQGRRQEALQECRTAYELNPTDPDYRRAYEHLAQQARSQLEPKPEPPSPAPPAAPTPVTQPLVRGNFVVQPLSYSSVRFTAPQGATQVKVKGIFRASGGYANDIQVVIASPLEFQNWINGRQAQVFYATGKVASGTIDVENIPPGDYVLAFSNKFSALSRKQVTALVTLSYVP